MFTQTAHIFTTKTASAIE